MRDFRNILYVGQRIAEEREGLKQALSLARNNDARLHVLEIYPKFPSGMADVERRYNTMLLEETKESIASTCEILGIDSDKLKIEVELAVDEKVAVWIIQQVLRESYDLLVKEAEPSKHSKGFRALDMALLRKCPCPVWLWRPIHKDRKNMDIAVAIDPESDEEAAVALSKQMLSLARSLADTCSGRLHIVSCWDYIYEDFLRNAPWSRANEESIQASVAEAQKGHRKMLDKLITGSGITGDQEVHHLRGNPEELLPALVTEKGIDILVMGTLARTGIAGLTIGNTAENIVQNLECSLVALKPKGFVSPISAY